MRRPTRESEKREKKRKMNLSVVFAKMAMLVLIMLLGYLCARIGITGPEFNKRVTPLVMNVLLTATILNSVLSVPDFTGRDIVDYVLVLTAATVLQIAAAWFLPRLLRTRGEDVGATRLVTAFGNVGFVGLPVVAAIFGDEMVFFASLANIPFNLALYSIGAAQLSGGAGARFDWRKVLNMPVIATLLSVVLLLSRIHVPAVIADTISTLAGAVLNIILDPIFIFECKWGMMGAAVATVLGQIVTAALAVWYLCRMKTVKPEKGDFRLRASLCTRMLPLGITSFLSQISLVAAMAAINNMLRKYGALDGIFSQEQYAQIPMAVVGIVMKFFQIVISIVVGMAAGCIPVVGYNMGAGKKTRVRELFTKLLLCEAIVGAVALVLAEGFPRQLIAVFGAANESSYYTDFAIKAFRTYLCMMVLACVNKACFIFLQAVGKAFSSTMLSMVREVVFGVGFALLLPRFFGLDGVLYSMPVSDVLTFVIAAVMIVKTYRELNTEGATVL